VGDRAGPLRPVGWIHLVAGLPLVGALLERGGGGIEFRVFKGATEQMNPTEADMKLLEEAAAKLGEHFDAVQILATRHDHELDGTVNVSFGMGNFFARYGHCRDWVVSQEERTRADVREEGK
jgi:hypothetical protein